MNITAKKIEEAAIKVQNDKLFQKQAANLANYDKGTYHVENKEVLIKKIRK